MGALLSYSLASGVVLVFLYLAYRCLLAQERQPRINRALLLSVYPLSLTAPFLDCRLQALFATGSKAGAVGIGLPQAGLSAEATSPGLLLSLLAWIYLGGVAAVLLCMVCSYMRLLRIVRSGRRIRLDDCTLVLLPDGGLPPFSWRGYVVMSERDYADDGEAILLHERCHLRGRHYLDLLLAQAVTAIQWFNPAAWLMMEELKTVHEYEADEAVIRSGMDFRAYQMLLIKKAVGARLPSIANSLNQSKLKKRVTMMYKSKPAPVRRLRGLALLPALALGLLAVNSSAVASVLSETSSATLFASAGDKVSENNPESVQGATAKTAVDDGVEPLDVQLDVEPSFPGGLSAMMQYLMKNVKYPEEAAKAREEGKVIVGFVVSATGKIRDVKINKSVSPLLDEEAMRVVRSMP
ncbi:MAG: M56 family metallopeptidase, partial [Muribaculaceae bacterium]|nr:M56 family metallopeptidase [Muribaculaceae bacterium]